MSKKDKEMNDMLQNSAVNFGLLQPTVTPAGVPAQVAPPAVEPKQETNPKKEKKDPAPPKSEKKLEKKETAQAPSADEANPFGYSFGPTWPLVGYDKPFLLPMPENQARGGAAFSVRIPLDLNMTIEAHLSRLGVKNLSEWVRHALERQLALEQQRLAKK